jgi:hypothetical protein
MENNHEKKREMNISSVSSSNSDEKIELKIDNIPVSPITFKRELAKTNEFRRDTYWKCMGGKIDKRMVDFGAKFSITLIMMGFCMTQIIMNNDDCNPLMSLYTSLLTLIIGFWLSAKDSHKDDK